MWVLPEESVGNREPVDGSEDNICLSSNPCPITSSVTVDNLDHLFEPALSGGAQDS